MSLVCGLIASAGSSGTRTPEPPVASVPREVITLDQQTTEVLLAMGVLEISEAEGTGPVVCLLRSTDLEFDILVVDSSDGGISDGGATSTTDDGRLWKPSDGLPSWTRDVGECKDGVKTVRFSRSVRVVTTCPDGKKSYAWVREQVVWTLKCSSAVPASPGPIAPDGNKPYQEGEAWPRVMPRTLPSEEGGSSKEFMPESVFPCQ